MFTEPGLKHVERRDAAQRMMKWQKEVECAQSSSLEMNRNEEYAWMKRYQEAAEWLLAVGIRYTWRGKKNKISIERLENSDVTTINQLENGSGEERCD